MSKLGVQAEPDPHSSPLTEVLGFGDVFDKPTAGGDTGHQHSCHLLELGTLLVGGRRDFTLPL